MENTDLSLPDIEVGKEIKNMKNEKSAGPGNINFKLIKYGGIKVLAFVTKLLNKILQKDNIPQEMKTGYLIQIYKKQKSENFRSISITNPLIKILGNVIKNLIEIVIKEMRNEVVLIKDD
jgi:hypothetical protein